MKPADNALTTMRQDMHLDVRTLTQEAQSLKGHDPLRHYLRLGSDLHGNHLDWPDLNVEWALRGEVIQPPGGKPQHWLHLQLRAQLPMTCQRCLGQVMMPVEFDNSYRLVADEATAEAEDEQCDEDLLVLSKQFDLRALLEDELLLELPLMPKHEVCPTDVKLASTDDDFKAALTQKPNAFAVLGSLKKAP
jgi:uncharacterized protein